MTAPELKPCPFCGGEAEIWRAHEGRMAWIACMGKCVVLISKEYLSNDEAIAAWNRRADLAAVQPVQVLETCGKCMGSGYGGHPDSGQLCADCNGSGGVEPQPDPRELTVWYGKMPESNGRENWTAILRPKAGDNLNGILDGFCFARSEYPDRVRYEADRMRWIIGELTEKPDILAYDADLHSGYVERPDPRDEVIARLVEENNWQIKARAQHWLRRTISAPEDAAVEEICEKYGYGAVMDAASRLWARKPYGSGAFYVGGCIGFKSDDEARAALAAAKAVQK